MASTCLKVRAPAHARDQPVENEDTIKLSTICRRVEAEHPTASLEEMFGYLRDYMQQVMAANTPTDTATTTDVDIKSSQITSTAYGNVKQEPYSQPDVTEYSTESQAAQYSVPGQSGAVGWANSSCGTTAGQATWANDSTSYSDPRGTQGWSNADYTPDPYSRYGGKESFQDETELTGA